MPGPIDPQAAASIARGEGIVWLLSLTLPDGRVVRVATRAVEVTSSGTPLRFDPYLMGVETFADEVDPFNMQGIASFGQARVSILTTEDFLELLADWHQVAASVGELAVLWEGSTFAQRRVVIPRGRMMLPEIGMVGEPTSFALEASPPTYSGLVGDPEALLSETFPTPTDTAGESLTTLEGVMLPVVIGKVKRAPAYKVGAFGGSNRLLLGEAFADTATSVQVYEDGVQVAGSFAVSNDPDGYAYVQDTINFRAQDGAYTFDAAGGGVPTHTDATRGTSNAADVLGYLLNASGVDVDWSKTERCFQYLRGWVVGVSITEAAPAFDVITQELLPVLPVVQCMGDAGVYFLYVDDLEGAPLGDLEVGQQLLPSGARMGVSDVDTVVNTFTVQYGADAFTGDPLGVVTVDASSSALCELSTQLYGERAEVVEAKCVQDEGTARRVAQAMARRRALPRRRVAYALSPDASYIEPGDVYLLTDKRYALVRARAVVTSKVRGAIPETVVFDLLDRHPVSRDSL